MGFPPPQFSVQADVSNGVARFAPSGELDMATAPTLEEHLDRALNDGLRGALLDLRDVTFMDATGVRLMIRASVQATQNGHEFAIVGVDGIARKVLELTGMDGLIDETAGMELIRRFTQQTSPAPETSSALTGEDHDG